MLAPADDQPPAAADGQEFKFSADRAGSRDWRIDVLGMKVGSGIFFTTGRGRGNGRGIGNGNGNASSTLPCLPFKNIFANFLTRRSLRT